MKLKVSHHTTKAYKRGGKRALCMTILSYSQCAWRACNSTQSIEKRREACTAVRRRAGGISGKPAACVLCNHDDAKEAEQMGCVGYHVVFEYAEVAFAAPCTEIPSASEEKPLVAVQYRPDQRLISMRRRGKTGFFPTQPWLVLTEKSDTRASLTERNSPLRMTRKLVQP